MNVKDQIRDLLDFPTLVAQSVDLPRSPNGRRATMARCPFHPDDTPSLAVYQDHAHCYGACGRSWDCFGWVMQRDGVDFPDALRECARLAGVTLPDWTPEQQQREQRRQTRADVLTAAMTYYRDQLIASRHLPDSALRYARSRGWSTRTILRTGALGYAPDDVTGLLRYLGIQGIDPAMALEAGILAKSASGRLYPRFRERLVFPFVRAGRCYYMTGRDMTGRDDVPKWFHLPVADGDHRPLYGAAGGAGPLVVVESPADALTLWQMGRDAVAVLGTTLPDGVCAALARHRPLYLALDPDPAGERGLHRLGGALGPRCQVVRLPGADINDILMSQGAGDAARTIESALSSSVSYVIYLAQSYRTASMDQQPEALDRLLGSVAKLDDRDMAMLSDTLVAESGLGRRQLKDLLATVQPDHAAEGYVPSLDNRYGVISGVICTMGETPTPLTNFSARITRMIRLDNGADIESEYVIEGRRGSGRPFPPARIPAGVFPEMKWIDEQWGVDAAIAAGQQKKVATAIKLMSYGAPQDQIYTHLGWRQIDGKRVFLHCDGALGYTEDGDIQVETGDDLSHYTLPSSPDHPADAFQASLRFLDAAARDVTFPLWASFYHAPLVEILRARFVLWLYGKSGTRKSALVSCGMQHFGDFNNEKQALSWESTANYLEYQSFIAKDVPLFIDDFKHQPNRYDMLKMRQAADRVIRSAGNETGRGRLDKSIKARTTYRNRALVISTGEMLPEIEPSGLARILGLRFTADTIHLEDLTRCQTEAGRYRHAMAGYILWLRDRWDRLAQELPAEFVDLRNRTGDQKLGRITEIICRNWIAGKVALAYGFEIGAINARQAADLQDEHWHALQYLAADQEDAFQAENPVERFVELLDELIETGKAWLAVIDQDNPEVNKPYQADFVGWQDSEHLWLNWDSAWGLIQNLATRAGRPILLGSREMKQRLWEEGLLIRSNSRRWTCRLQRGLANQRLTKIRRENFYDYL